MSGITPEVGMWIRDDHTMIIVDCLLCMVIGGALFAYCGSGLSDGFWSRRTQRLHLVGVVAGAATFVFGAVFLVAIP